jgi:hypothetical protein
MDSELEAELEHAGRIIKKARERYWFCKKEADELNLIINPVTARWKSSAVFVVAVCASSLWIIKRLSVDS